MEMLLVLGIIALLVGMGTYMMVNVLGDAEVGKVRADIQTFKASLIRYKTAAGNYPTTGQGLDALVTKPTDGPKPRSWKQFLQSGALVDPWGNDYQYRYPAQMSSDAFDVFSIGEDMKAGTEDDIGNWEPK